MNDEISTLLENQQQVGLEITKIYELFKKEGRKRRNKLERLIEWQTRLDQAWSKFLENHGKIIVNEDELEQEAYFKENYFEFIKLFVQEMESTISLQLNLEKRKNGVEIENEQGEINNQEQENEENDAKSEASDIELGFVTTMGEFIEREQSTPKFKRTFINENDGKIAQFVTLGKNLARKIDEIEELAMNGLKVRARIILRDMKIEWKKFNEELASICSIAGEDENTYYKAYQQVARKYYQALEEIGEEPTNRTEHRNLQTIDPIQLKLTPLKIPKFHGTYESWPTFSGLFETLIIANQSLSDIQRMQYLKTVVEDEAERAIASLRITEENFQKAWTILKERFDNKRAIIDKQIKKAMDLERVQHISAQQLRNFHDQSKECYALLKDVSSEQILIHIFKNKLDNLTKSLYQQQIEENENNESMNEFFVFLNKRCRVLETMDFKKQNSKEDRKTNQNQNKTKDNAPWSCCEQPHPIYFCEKFKTMKVNERSELVKRKSLCILCLRSNHKVNECTYKKMCPSCGKKHNGMLHFGERNEQKNVKKSYMTMTNKESNNDSSDDDNINNVQMASYTVNNASEKIGTLLATAIIKIKTSTGWSEQFRVLIDQGSMTSFISERLVKYLNLKQKKTNINILGIAGSVEPAKGLVEIEIGARYPTPSTTPVTAIVLGKLTSTLPNMDFDKSIMKMNEIKDLILADPNFNKQARIDMILGADVFCEIILPGLIKASDKSFVAQETTFGWILSGPVGKNNRSAICMVAELSSIDQQMQKFWEIEELADEKEHTADEKRCLQIFRDTVIKNADGTYTVALPFKENAAKLGDSKKMAVAQLLQLEKRFMRDTEFMKKYREYINELIKKGYMEKVGEISGPNMVETGHCYLPHHAVFKQSTTTKVRPVFDASRKTTNGISLNDTLITGPKLQEELVDILARFRLHKIAFTADIEKMYLHVKLREQDQDY